MAQSSAQSDRRLKLPESAQCPARADAPTRSRREPDRWDVYKWVGKCLSEWEHAESALARLYDLLLDRKSPSAALRRYGEPRLFEDRAALVERAADRHFASKPDDRLKADVADLLSRLRQACEQRDEIAHGMVVRMAAPSGSAAGPDGGEYALTSRQCAWRVEIGEEAPGHARTPHDLQRAALVFFSLALDVTRHRHRIARAAASR